MASINYNDERFTKLEADKQSALNQSNKTYDSLISQSGGHYDKLINQSKEWADKQAEIQNQQTDFTIEKIEQQKDKAEKDYTKEQKGAYQDYMKQSNAYGSSQQAVGQQGLSGSGWAETIRAGYYNTYQNRYAQARESYQTIVMNYDNNIKEAQLQNSSALASIYAEAQKEQLELALQSFTVLKDLSLAKQNAYLDIDRDYNDRWRAIESQINTENALAEQIRQYNESLAEQKRQADMDNAYKLKALAQDQAQWQKEYNLAVKQANKSSGGSGGSGNDDPTIKKDNDPTIKKKTTLAKGTTTGSIIASNLGDLKKSTSSSSSKASTVEKQMGQIYKLAYSTKKTFGDGVADKMGRQAQKEYLAKAYQNGMINEEEFRTLVEKYGF